MSEEMVEVEYLCSYCGGRKELLQKYNDGFERSTTISSVKLTRDNEFDIDVCIWCFKKVFDKNLGVVE